jgi:hypothetical protein
MGASFAERIPCAVFTQLYAEGVTGPVIRLLFAGELPSRSLKGLLMIRRRCSLRPPFNFQNVVGTTTQRRIAGPILTAEEDPGIAQRLLANDVRVGSGPVSEEME